MIFSIFLNITDEPVMRHRNFDLKNIHAPVVMRDDREVYSVSSIGMLPFIEGSLGDCTSGLVAVSHDSEEHA